MRESGERSGLDAVRRLLILLLIAGMLGIGADLLLLGHYENAWQTIPLGLLTLGLAAAAAALVGGGLWTVAGLRVVMALFICAGMLGIGLHYGGTSEAQRELDPNLEGWSLFVKAVTMKAPPALAPAAMIQLGLLGLLSTYRHPALEAHLDFPDPPLPRT